jgi:hypothetical protein
MKSKELRQHIERQLVGKLPTTLNGLSALEDLLPHWDVLDSSALETHTLAIAKARSSLHDLLDLLEESVEEGPIVGEVGR